MGCQNGATTYSTIVWRTAPMVAPGPSTHRFICRSMSFAASAQCHPLQHIQFFRYNILVMCVHSHLISSWQLACRLLMEFRARAATRWSAINVPNGGSDAHEGGGLDHAAAVGAEQAVAALEAEISLQQYLLSLVA